MSHFGNMGMIQKIWNIQNILLTNNSSVNKFTKAASSVFFDNRIATLSHHKTSFDYQSNNADVFIDSLPLPLRHDAAKAFSFQNDSNSTSLDLRIGHLEISSRSQLISLTQDLADALHNAAHQLTVDQLVQFQKTTESTELPSLLLDCEEALEELLLFLRSVADLCICIITMARCEDSYTGESERKPSKYDFKRFDTPLVGRLPFILLEDVVETLPAHFMQLVWIFGPSTWLYKWCREKPNTLSVLNRQLDTIGPLFASSSSHFALIRCCNKVIKKNGNLGFTPGSLISPYLSLCTAPDVWAKIGSDKGGTDARISDTCPVMPIVYAVSTVAFTGQAAMILASVLPLSDPSVAHTSGAVHNDRYCNIETIQQFEARKSKSSMATLTDPPTMTYDHYSSFWSIQQVCADPSSILPQGKSSSSNSQEWLPRLGSFLVNLRAMLDTFKTVSSVSIHPSIDGRDLAPRNMKDNRKGSSPHTLKYLIDSSLHQAQWQDPKTRIDVLFQILITCSFIQSQLRSTPSLPIKIKTVLINHSTNIQNILEECKILLSQTSPDGKEYLKTVTWILNDREPMWRLWKQNKCIPPIEDVGYQNAKNKCTNIITQDQTVKESMMMTCDAGIMMKRETAAPPNKEMSMRSFYAKAMDSFCFSIDISIDLPSLSKSLKNCAPTLDNHFKDYIEALDPEAGIEEEYHPRNDLIWKWRAMRLLNEKIFHYNDKHLVRKTDGDFEGLVRTIWAKEKGMSLPGEENFSHRCQLENDLQLDELEDNEVEEAMISNALQTRAKRNQPKTASPSCIKDAESFSSGEIDENEIGDTINEALDTEIIERSEVSNNLHDTNRSISDCDSLFNSGVSEDEATRVESVDIEGLEKNVYVAGNETIEATSIRTTEVVTGLDPLIKSRTECLVTMDTTKQIQNEAKETREDFIIPDVVEGNNTVIEGPADSVNGDHKQPIESLAKIDPQKDYIERSLDGEKKGNSVPYIVEKHHESMTNDTPQASNDPRKRKFDSSYAGESLERPSKKVAVEEAQIKQVSTDSNRNSSRVGQYHYQRRNESYMSTSAAPITTSISAAPITSNVNQGRGNFNRPGYQYHANLNRVNNSHQHIPPAPIPPPPPTSHSSSATGLNRRDGNRGYNQNMTDSQSSSNVNNRRSGGDRGYGDGDRRSGGGYTRQR